MKVSLLVKGSTPQSVKTRVNVLWLWRGLLKSENITPDDDFRAITAWAWRLQLHNKASIASFRSLPLTKDYKSGYLCLLCFTFLLLICPPTFWKCSTKLLECPFNIKGHIN